MRADTLAPVILIAVISSLSLFGCGPGPIGQCSSACPDPKQWRDWSCDCQGPTSTSPQSPTNPFDPSLIRESVLNGCTSFQEHDYILNPNKFDLDVLIGYREPDGTATGSSTEAWYTVSANATTIGTAYDLGLKFTDPNCFDRDYFIKTWQAHLTGATRLVGAHLSLPAIGVSTPLETVVQSLDPASRERISARLTQFQNAVASYVAKRTPNKSSPSDTKPLVRTETRVAARLDCPSICNDPTDFRCFSTTPPDGSRTAMLRDKILATSSNSTIKTADLLTIFGLSNDPCSRGDTSVDSSQRIQNDGEICAYPILITKTDRKPVAAFHIGRNISGYASGNAKAASVAFTKPNELPSFIFGQNVLNDDYGGKVLAISADTGAVYINTVRGCVALQVAP
jgi:hypothetical protein